MRDELNWRRASMAPLRTLFAAVEAVDRLDLRILARIPQKHKRRLARKVFRLLASLTPGLVHRHGMVFRVPDGAAYSYLFREHEPETQRLLAAVLRPGMVAVDVGANIGYLTLLMARAVAPGGRVIALEPGLDNRSFLEENVVRNRVSETVMVLPYAAGAVRSTRLLHSGGAGTLNSLFGSRSSRDTGSFEEVEVVTLDDTVHECVDLVKIDVEGAEIEVLDGMIRLLAAIPAPRLVVEWNPSALASAGHPPDAVPRRLLSSGYKLRLLDPSGRRPPGVEAALDEVAQGLLPPTWYTNLLAEPIDGAASPDVASKRAQEDRS